MTDRIPIKLQLPGKSRLIFQFYQHLPQRFHEILKSCGHYVVIADMNKQQMYLTINILPLDLISIRTFSILCNRNKCQQCLCSFMGQLTRLHSQILYVLSHLQCPGCKTYGIHCHVSNLPP